MQYFRAKVYFKSEEPLGTYSYRTSSRRGRCTGHATMSTNVGTMGQLQCTNLSLLSGQTKNPLAIVVWKPWVTDQRCKIQGDVLLGILPKNTIPTRATQCAFIALQKFYSDNCLKYFCVFPNNISFSFLLQFCFSIAIFLPRVLICQKRHISLPVGYKTPTPKTGDWERLWRQFRTPTLAKNRFLSHFLIVS